MMYTERYWRLHLTGPDGQSHELLTPHFLDDDPWDPEGLQLEAERQSYHVLVDPALLPVRLPYGNTDWQDHFDPDARRRRGMYGAVRSRPGMGQVP